ncbi:MAG: transcriptional repressor [Clostridia bacterium]|nr:transcriptional repressor [Clostridia bacterium]
MAGYQTKPRMRMLEFLMAHPEESYTAEELTAAMETEYGSEAPGKSTVYRLVGKLAQEEQVRRFEKEGVHLSYYQINRCRDHLHLKCTDCGKLIHMKHSASAMLMQEILQSNGFSVNEHQTVLYGRCNNCKGSV